MQSGKRFTGLFFLLSIFYVAGEQISFTSLRYETTLTTVFTVPSKDEPAFGRVILLTLGGLKMRHTLAIQNIYNGLIQKYQFDLSALHENQAPDTTRFFMLEKHRESMTYKLDWLAQMAAELGEGEMAGEILTHAANLGADGVMPKPMLLTMEA